MHLFIYISHIRLIGRIDPSINLFIIINLINILLKLLFKLNTLLITLFILPIIIITIIILLTMFQTFRLVFLFSWFHIILLAHSITFYVITVPLESLNTVLHIQALVVLPIHNNIFLITPKSLKAKLRSELKIIQTLLIETFLNIEFWPNRKKIQAKFAYSFDFLRVFPTNFFLKISLKNLSLIVRFLINYCGNIQKKTISLLNDKTSKVLLLVYSIPFFFSWSGQS